MDFIKSYLEYTKHYESPTSFWKWSAYACIASILRDNVYKIFGDLKVCPNIYVLLLAESAAHRKGNPVGLCERYVEYTGNTKVISGRSSIQAILDELAKSETHPINGRIIAGGGALFSARELSAGIVDDKEAVGILTDIYDYKEVWISRLRGTGQFRIKNLCFTMLAASNEDMLKGVYNNTAMYGGLLGRTFLVKPDEFRPANSLFEIKADTKLMESLHKALQEISLLKGEFTFTDDAKKEYEAWYSSFRESYKEKGDRSGVSGRIHTGVIKIAMINTVNDTRLLNIDKIHIEKAIEECITLIPNYTQYMMSAGKSNQSEVCAALINNAHENEDAITRKRVLSKNWQNFSSEDLDKAAATLEQAGFIQMIPSGSEIVYKLTEKCVEALFQK